ncbi:hypothetical protein A3860_10975 [Niastella vici]|uniref:Uncharacterized protein n=1 Tax=Niastella vici TaxID=1703345 RepID=A0A1V9FFN2_9BACT|nr:hypothetical protein [Niastella vici]OQP57081.1 hypothetical protein A3860_10975 [Niastella vici]
MNLKKYPVISTNEHRTYEFLSEGPNGTIKKVIYFQEVEENLFNLAFGDWNENEQGIDDKARSNNHDRDKVMATVASAVLDFITHYPDARIFAKGSTQARTRLYQIGIFANLHEISQIFVVEGYMNDDWHPFEKLQNYQAFLVRLK